MTTAFSNIVARQIPTHALSRANEHGFARGLVVRKCRTLSKFGGFGGATRNTFLLKGRSRDARSCSPRNSRKTFKVQATSDYVPSPMDTSMLTAQLEVLAAVAVMVVYWWYVLVPNARVNLAVNKKKGNLRQYLAELKQDDSRGLERWFYSTWLEKIDPETKFLLREEDSKPEPEYKVEETMDEIVKNARRTPRFWSLDNPVLVGTALTIGLAAITGGIGEFMQGL
mmetsp:Transcript_24246/g.52902  ORF Transcript_24246/g.52902 Transcript_24246/m.52902 type:complete len:226 (-) Transcript_24246:97-774(-)